MKSEDFEKLDRWDIVISKAPGNYQDSQFKPRPAVVISGAKFHKECDMAVIIPLSSTVRPGAMNIPLKVWEEVGLHQPSVAKIHPFSICSADIGVRLGKLSFVDIKAVEHAVKKILG